MRDPVLLTQVLNGDDRTGHRLALRNGVLDPWIAYLHVSGLDDIGKALFRPTEVPNATSTKE
jgi:hypothetical protein